ncbi:hypothetical protein J2Z32_001492 [Paenibacillus turicensis]|uniref:Protein kinase domain-containing protein n=1 Tax=Paenibacillus turicensis TaxID=160487 RepID=A0ABS4FQK9_9BACL|nr:hypothetical protein [Paenibacillus turicensis]MBP1904868.1 hypothetical protein [Paenibacillus turicensis]
MDHNYRQLYNKVINTKNQSLSYYNSHSLLNKLATHIVTKCLSKTELLTIHLLLDAHDFRIIGDYLFALNNRSDPSFKSCIESLSKGSISYFEYQFMKYQIYSIDKKRSLKFVKRLDQLFDTGIGQEKDVLVYVENESDKETVEGLFLATGGDLSGYFDAQFDLPGINSLVRAGLVKKVYLNKKRAVITKRNNPNKQGRFLNEQRMVVALKEKLLTDEELNQVYINPNASFNILSPNIVIADNEELKFYSVSNYVEGPTLEEVLLNESNFVVRRNILKDIRELLDYLYDNGVLWGDMAPRNIILNQLDGKRYYSILDFEKTKIFENRILHQERIDHCRGYMCIEEFGAVCSREEVEYCFRDYFDPCSWDTNSSDPVTFKMKNDFIEILSNRGVDVSIGNYNRLELEMMEIRFPLPVSNVAKRHPLYVSFKIDHYIGPEYDRKTSEILLEAKKKGCFIEILDLFELELQNFEVNLIEREFLALSISRYSSEEETHAEKRLKLLVDSLYKVFQLQAKKQ